MIQLNEDHLIIQLDHTCPQEALKDLQAGIIEALICQFTSLNEIPLTEEQKEGYCLLLELLKATLGQSIWDQGP